MSLILLASILIRLVAAAGSVVIYRRVRDWRMLFLTAMLLLMASRQLLTLAGSLRQKATWQLEIGAHFAELPGLVVSVLAALAVVFLGRMLAEQKRGEVALLERERQLWQSQKLEAVGKLAGGIAHDFNNLLTVMSGHVELARLSLGPSADPRVSASLDEIESATQRASALTKQILTFARGQETNRVVFDLNDLIRDLEPMLHSLLGDPVELLLSLAEGVLPLEADRTQVGQVVLNMAVNGRDAMPQGGALTICTHSSSPGALPQGQQGVVFTVTDTGVGMNAEQRERAFEPFFSTKGKGGSGLGLSICYGVVMAHQGTLALASELGAWSKFTVTLPRCDRELAEVSPRRTPARGGRETVLVVEDEAPVRSVVCRTLRDLGYAALEAGDGTEAIELLERLSGGVDLVLSDVTMPRMGGVELAARLRSGRVASRVLLMSGYAEDLDPGAGVFLQKPFSQSELDEAIRAALSEPTPSA